MDCTCRETTIRRANSADLRGNWAGNYHLACRAPFGVAKRGFVNNASIAQSTAVFDMSTSTSRFHYPP